jgi:hypothetical protein
MAISAREDQKKRLIEVNRQKLVNILYENRTKHIKDYQEALDGYKLAAISKLNEGYEKAKSHLEKNIAAARENINAFDPEKLESVSDYIQLVDAINIKLPVPRNCRAEYDAAIAMAEWDVRETLELTHAEFQCFVRDIWDWTDNFTAVSNIYKSLRGV